MKKRCTVGKSCGSTCITRADDCVIELSVKVAGAIAKAKQKLRLGEMAFDIRKKGNQGDLAKFEAIRGQLAKEVGGRLNKQEHLQELKKRLQDASLLPKTQRPATKKEEGLGDIFNRNLKLKAPETFRPAEKVKIPGSNQEPDNKSKGAASKLEDALGLGPQTRKEVGRDLKALRSEAARQRDEMEVEQAMALMEGNTSRARSLSARIKKLEEAMGPGGVVKGSTQLSTSGGSSLTGNSKWAREEAKDFDFGFSSLKDLKQVKGTKDKIDWEESINRGTKLGEGSFGTAMLVKGASPYVVKRGEIAETEAPIIKKVGELGIGPKLLFGETAGPRTPELGVMLQQGRLAMGLVPGKSVEDITNRPTTKVNDKDTVADAYFKARATLHRAGIAHNDAHVGNVLIDDKGKARFVDLGLAQDNPKAALAEAIGVFATRDQLPRQAVLVRDGHEWGDFQAMRFPAFGVATLGLRDAPQTLTRMRDNKTDVYNWLYRQKGFNRDEVAALTTSGIRRPLTHYEKGVWGKLSNEDAKHLIDMLYEGV